MDNKDKVWHALRCLTYREMQEVALILSTAWVYDERDPDDIRDWASVLSIAAEEQSPEAPA